MLTPVLGILAALGLITSAGLLAIKFREEKAGKRPAAGERALGEELRQARKKALDIEQRLDQREEFLEKKDADLRRREEALFARQRNLDSQSAEVEKRRREQLQRLEEVASLTRSEARDKILSETEKGLKNEVARRIKQSEERVRCEVDQRAKEILVDAIQRSATDYVAEYTTTAVRLADEEMKGRIIGREGRNIKALERATGADFEIDETPGEVRVSCLDPVRREIAKLALLKLIADGRIQPARIEETVSQVKKELEREFRRVGEEVALKAEVTDLPAEIFPLLGRLKYRTSYGQNQLEHTLEVVNLAKALATAVGGEVELVKKAALLHDIGKVRTVEEEGGSHVEIGRKILTKAGFDEGLIHAAMAHHQDEEFKSVEAVLVYAADAISAARPGARLEDYEKYLSRIHQLEDIAKGFVGIKEVYAISAGREVRVIVKPEEIDDAATAVLAHEIAKKIKEEAKYPGVVKVNVIRELRAADVAK